MNETELKNQIKDSINSFSDGRLYENSLKLFNTLGYKTERKNKLSKNTFKGFLNDFPLAVEKMNPKKMLNDCWIRIDLLFQLTQSEMIRQSFLFDTNKVDNTIIEAYLFFSIDLKPGNYTRTQLSEITRELNKGFPMPVMILFKNGNYLTLSVINRRLHKRDESKDVLEKVTLIKDINIENPHRAHIEILYDLSFDELKEKRQFSNFVELHNAWQKTLDTKELNNKFFKELSNWYFWAQRYVSFPNDIKLKEKNNIQINLIRLITRLIFVWFIKEKNLVNEKLFDVNYLRKVLKVFDPKNKKAKDYYPAILQNLFFATLNQKMTKRVFVKDGSFKENKEHYGVKSLYRYASLFEIDEKEVIKLFKDIPFLNGGLFDCLDKENEESGKVEYIDGFSRNPKKIPVVPDFLLFGEEKDVDLSEEFGNKRKKEYCSGIIEIFKKYKFTIEENTPIEEEIALDPELLGKVFESLLAYYNPETETTARKQTGSFYTPREIVNYMVDESITAHLKTKMLEDSPAYIEFGKNQTEMFGNEERKDQLVIEQSIHDSNWIGKEEELENELRKLVSYNEEETKFNENDKDKLIKAIDSSKILDPACGSGAFPMGILHKLVYILSKLDKDNNKWRKLQKSKAQFEIDKALNDKDRKERENKLIDINDAFEDNSSDFGRKLFLIENCIYGVDIQPIAVQIAKLRFFISLVVDQSEKPIAANRGIRPLPNLETKFVAANTLIGLEKPEGIDFRNSELIDLENQLRLIRHKHFEAKNRNDKLECQKEDKKIRKQIAEIIKKEYDNFEANILKQIEKLKNTLKLSKKAKVKDNEKEKYQKAVKDLENKILKLNKLLEETKSADDTANKISSFDIYDQNKYANWFEPEWMFGKDLEKGFDIVIGNPPYVRAESPLISELRNKILSSNHYETLWEKWDLYVAFIEKGFKLLATNGILEFIIPDAYMSSKYSLKSHKYFLEKSTISRINFCSELQIFDAAVKNIIIEFKNSIIQSNIPKRFKHVLEWNNFYPIPSISQTELGESCFKEEIKNEMKGNISNSFCWGEICYVSYGLRPSSDERFWKGEFKKEDLISDKKDKIHPKAYVEGKWIEKYKIEQIKYLEWNTDRSPSKLVRPTFNELYEPDKILKGRMTSAIYDNTGLLCNDSCIVSVFWKDLSNVWNLSVNNSVRKDFSVKGDKSFLKKFRKSLEENSSRFNLKYLLAILNSTFGNNFLNSVRRSQIGFYPDDLKKLPIKKISFKDQETFVSLVNKIMEKKSNGKETIDLENKIDVMVYKLYDLTYEEVKIFDPEFWMSEREYEKFKI